MDKNPPNLSNLSQGSADRDHNGALGKTLNGPVGMPPRPGQVICGDIGMHIDHHGIWYYRGSSINRQELVKLFSTVLRRDDVGDHWLITPAEMARVSVEDAAYMAVELFAEGEGHDQVIRFRTNIDAEVTLNGDHPLRVEVSPDDETPSPYVALDYGLEAKLNRPVFYQLVSLGVEEIIDGDHIFGIWSDSDFFPIGEMPKDDV